ncbi:MAG: Hpt domain-containing protein [Intestinimonas sp.]|jgi:HPt (histidine-containing phosphotransfer) domain-containing protein|nr:Hpt domain-containing protein [Intestinimonas sp.]
MAQSNFIRRLADWGCDTRGALERMLEDEGFYRDCLAAFYQDKGFEMLAAQLKHCDVRGAFETSHMLKGVAANLGLTPLYKIICSMVEPLRAGRLDGVPELYQAMMQQRKTLRQCILT